MSQHQSLGKMRSIDTVIFDQRSEQPGCEIVKLVGQTRIFQKTVQSEHIGIKQILAMLFTTGLLSQRDSTSKHHPQFKKRAIVSTMNNPERVNIAMFQQRIAHL